MVILSSPQRVIVVRVKSLTLRHYRNVTEQVLDFSPGKNIVLGKNGHGKTNLLEALYLLSHSRSHRTSTDRELVQAGADFAAVTLVVTPHAYDGEIRLEAQLRLDAANRLKTVFKQNGTPLKSRSQVLGHLPSVSFFNTDMMLLRGSPSDRRRWLDAAVTQYDKRHFTMVAEFEKVRKQKSRLLKEGGLAVPLEHLAVWNEQFALTAARLTVSRVRYLRLIHDAALVQYLELSGGQEALDFDYTPSTRLADRLSNPAVLEEVQQLEALYREALAACEREELQRGLCVLGPHRDDIGFTLGGLDACAYGSLGQQRTIVLALKLTELDVLTRTSGEPPILLLDDVMAELDPQRQQYLMDRVRPDIQVFLTTTHLDPQLNPVVHRYLQDGDSTIFTVSQGQVAVSGAKATTQESDERHGHEEKTKTR